MGVAMLKYIFMKGILIVCDKGFSYDVTEHLAKVSGSQLQLVPHTRTGN